VVVDLLGAIAVMDVGIDNGNPPNPVFAPQVFDHDRLVVNIAEAAVAVSHGHGVMPRRADNGKTVFYLVFDEGVTDNEGPAR